MSWTPAPLSISKVTDNPGSDKYTFNFVVQGAGFAPSCEILLLHTKATALVLIDALKSANEDPSRGVVRATSVVFGSDQAISCTASTKHALVGEYRMVAAQITGEELHVAVSAGNVLRVR